jgi:predicted Zn-dependent peptidase
VLALCVASPDVVAAQTPAAPALDRSKIPEPGAAPTFNVPYWSRATLANGAELVVSTKRDLPLVSVNINFIGGTNQFEEPGKLGVGSFTAQMLNEGTTTRSGDQLANAQQLLGTQISAGVGGESGSIGFTALSDKLEPALALMADMLLNPSLPGDALERLRAQRLVTLTQQKDQVNAIANNVFSRVLYGDAHPYGRVLDEQSTRAITRDDVVAFHQAYFRPGRAVITVVGDVDGARVRAAFESAFAAWQPGGERSAFAYPATPPARARTIYLVDKPGAAQSVIAVGTPGPSRDTPDFYALSVMNNILGGLFQSRLNHLIREVKGYSYGVSSSFAFGRGPGRFRASGQIITAKTDSALMDFMAELRGVQGGKPFSDAEIKQGKESLIQGLPRSFASVDAAANAISNLYVQGLPESYYEEYAARINLVTPDDLVRVARKYIDLDHLNIIVVGDRTVIEEPLRRAGIAPIVRLDIAGRPVTTP